MKCSTNDEKFASFAAQESYKSTMFQRHGCIAVINGKIVARGHNSHYKVPFDKQICTSCHAEQDVLKNIIKNIKNPYTTKINIYIVRCKKDGGFTQSEPCLNCHNQMKKFNIKYIIYSTEDGNLDKLLLSDFNTDFMSSGVKALMANRIKPLNISSRVSLL